MLRMTHTLFLSSALMLGACTQQDDGFLGESNIVGGVPISIEQAPWQISLQVSGFGHFCGGSILSDEWILTAQHCTEALGNSPERLQVVAGITRLSQPQGGQVRGVAEVIIFPGFVDPSEGKDVSLLRLSQPLTLDGVRTRAIPIADDVAVSQGLINEGVLSTTSGWGALSSGGPSPDDLQGVRVPIVTNEQAQDAYGPLGFTITDDQLGAGFLGVGGRDSCQGDSGGPLSVPDATGTGEVLAGVVSWGVGCAEPDLPGLYARVSSFADFIRQATGEPDL